MSAFPPAFFPTYHEENLVRCSPDLARKMLGLRAAPPAEAYSGSLVLLVNVVKGECCGMRVCCIDCAKDLGVHVSGEFDESTWVHECSGKAVA